MFGLDCLGVGKSAVVKQLNADGSMRRRLLDIGLIENTVVELIRGAVIAIRKQDCEKILVSPKGDGNDGSD